MISYDSCRDYLRQHPEIISHPTTPNFTTQSGCSSSIFWKSADSLNGAQLPHTPWIADGLLPAGLAILAAPPKAGKSWMVLALCAAVAGGTPFFGFRTVAGDALYLDLEGTPARLQDRARTAGLLPLPSRMCYANQLDGATLADGSLIQRLEAWENAAESPRLVVVDTFQRVKGNAGSRGQNAYETDYATIAPLQRFALEHDLCVLLVHHLRKAGRQPEGDVFERVTGSTGLTGAADTSIVLDRKRGTDDAVIHVTGRDVEEQELALHFDCGRWSAVGTCAEVQQRQAAAEYDADPVVQCVLRLSQTNPDLKITLDELRNSAADLNLFLPQTSNRELSNHLKRIAPLLSQRSNITYLAPIGSTRGRRLHRFRNIDVTIL